MKEGAISPYIVLAPAEDDADGEEPQMSIANTGWSEEEMGTGTVYQHENFW